MKSCWILTSTGLWLNWLAWKYTLASLCPYFQVWIDHEYILVCIFRNRSLIHSMHMCKKINYTLAFEPMVLAQTYSSKILQHWFLIDKFHVSRCVFGKYTLTISFFLSIKLAKQIILWGSYIGYMYIKCIVLLLIIDTLKSENW